MSINERISFIIEEQYNGNKRAFATAIGVAATVIENIVGSRQGKPSYGLLEKICSNANISPDWLLTGEGSMLKNQLEYSTFTKIPPHQQPQNKTRPHIPLNASAGSLSFDAKSVLESQCEHYPLIPGLPNYDFTIAISGDSMEPQFRHGDIVACRLQRNEAPIQGGHAYVVDSIDGVVLKRIFDNGDSIRCHSNNPAYPDFTIPKSEINRMALVVGMIRLF